MTERPRASKADVTGSDKNTAFRLPCRPELNAVLVFEAPIDLMSYCTLHRQVTSNAVACADSMRGRWIHTCGRIRSSGTLSCAWTQMSRASLQWNACGPSTRPQVTWCSPGRLLAARTGMSIYSSEAPSGKGGICDRL